MDSRTALKISIEMADFVCMSYLNDLTDSELMMRPHKDCNHINWQIGHLILSEHEMMSGLANFSAAPLPADFEKKYSRETVGSDDPAHFCSKAELMAAYKSQREATLKYLASCSDADLDNPTGVDYAPNVGAMIAIQGSHWLMHCGQWVVVRRALGKPIVM